MRKLALLTVMGTACALPVQAELLLGEPTTQTLKAHFVMPQPRATIKWTQINTTLTPTEVGKTIGRLDLEYPKDSVVANRNRYFVMKSCDPSDAPGEMTFKSNAGLGQITMLLKLPGLATEYEQSIRSPGLGSDNVMAVEVLNKDPVTVGGDYTSCISVWVAE
ncbi:hypothetical protein NRI63_002412 [Salmonella enterica]|nr:hypothetical protein [Salmonella enterica]